MGDNSLNDVSSLINQQTEIQEDLSESLTKIEALAQVAIMTDFLATASDMVIYHYLWALNDMITQAKDLSLRSLNTLLKEKPVTTGDK